MSYRRLPIVAGLMLAFATSAAAVFAQQSKDAASENRERNLHAYVELLRSDLRTEKVAIFTEVMQFTEEQDKQFWPIYREYETQLAKINDERLKLILEYADAYQKMTDPVAERLAKGSLDLEAKRNALKTTTYDKMKTALGPTSAARFLQVENQILLIIDMQIAASLPVIE